MPETPTIPADARIAALAQEVARLRKSRHLADNQLQELILKVTEIQLNLAVQDKTLGKLDSAVNGNGKLGLVTRVDRVERISGGLTRAVWLLAAAAISVFVKLLCDRFG
jgi:hypothetical protein